MPGGTLHTAKYALMYNKKLFVYNPKSDEIQYAGNNKLLKENSEIDSFDFLNITTSDEIAFLKEKLNLIDAEITDKESIVNAITSLL